MALCLNRLGRPILKYAIKSPRLNRLADAFGQFVHHKITQRYTPGLTRESFQLWQLTNPGDVVQIKPNGFYRDEQKLCGNEYISKFITDQGIHELNIDDNFFPEYFTCEKTLAFIRAVPQAGLTSLLSYGAYAMFTSYGLALGAAYAVASAIWALPIYQIMRIFRGQNVAERKLFFWQLEQFSARVKKSTIKGIDNGFVKVFQPNRIFGGESHAGDINGSIAFHEISHLYGASENSAYYFSGLYYLRELAWKKFPRFCGGDIFNGIPQTMLWFLLYNFRAFYEYRTKFFRLPGYFYKRWDKIDFDKEIINSSPNDTKGFKKLVELFVLARAQFDHYKALEIADKIIRSPNLGRWISEQKAAFLFEYAQALEDVGEAEKAIEIYRSIISIIDNDGQGELAQKRIEELSLTIA